MRTVEVVATGAQALVQDLGRPGHAELGVPPSGALDVPALRLANRLAGNVESAAGIEALLGGLSLRPSTSCTMAITGALVTVDVDGRQVGTHVAVHVARGQTLTIGRPSAGLRCYVAVSGGLEVPAELGSRSYDVLSEIGPPPLEPGDVLPLGAPGLPDGSDVVAPHLPSAELVVRAWLGPRDDWFTDAAATLAGPWTVTSDSNRVGVRLDGAALCRVPERDDAELPSEGLLTGAIQVPPNGLPVVFLADHPTTGGYPVIGVVSAEHLPGLAQAAPGTTVRFRAAR